MKMDRDQLCSSSSILRAVLFLLLAGLAASSTISSDPFESRGSTGRSLLQLKKSCPVNFESMNYTIITSQCKGPNYLPKPCCDAFKQFACPFANLLNDLTNDCATIMFNYIHLHGKYPPGLFASYCREGINDGLSCPPSAPKLADRSASAATATVAGTGGEGAKKNKG